MKVRNVAIIAKKELRGLYSEKTIILAILLQLFIAMFSSFLMVGLASMYDPDSIAGFSKVQYPVAYTGEDSPLKEYLRDSDDFRIYDMDLSTAVAALRERKLSAVIFVPETPPDADDPVKITLYTIENDIQTTVVNVKLKDVFLGYEEFLRVLRSDRLDSKPVPIDIPTTMGGDFYEFVYGLLIPLLVFLPAIVSSALIIDLITEEYQHDTLETLMATPISFAEMVWGKVAATFLLVPLQSGAWLLLLMANGIAIDNLIAILMHVSAGSLFLIMIGAITALFYRERTDAQFVFSTALVVVILLVLALPYNPLNLIVRLSVSSVGLEHWVVLGAVMMATSLFGFFTHRYAEHVSQKIFAVR
jgi:ABC-2 type transport system permease protein